MFGIGQRPPPVNLAGQDFCENNTCFYAPSQCLMESSHVYNMTKEILLYHCTCEYCGNDTVFESIPEDGLNLFCEQCGGTCVIMADWVEK